MNLHGPDEAVYLPKGFLWSAVKAGIKASGRADVALAVSPLGASAAAMFTRNRVVAAPLEVDRKHLRRSRGRVRAVLVNAGNANCATGAQGIAVAEQSCVALGEALEAAPAPELRVVRARRPSCVLLRSTVADDLPFYAPARF